MACLALGYFLFLGILIAENCYTLNAMRELGKPGLAAESFRAGWLAWCRAFPPTRWFIQGPCQHHPHLSLALFVPAAILLAAGYLGALRAVYCQPEAWTLRRLVRCAALVALPLCFMVPVTSSDWVAYVLAGRILSVYHQSPWHHPLVEFPRELVYLAASTWGPQLKCVYGPVWVAVMGLTTGVTHVLAPGDMTLGSLLINLMLVRLANVAALAAAAVAVWRIQEMLCPPQQRLVTAAFLLNPLVVWESLGAVHNEIWGVAFLLWACYLFLRQDGRAVVPLALSILTKYVAVAVAPFMAIYYWRRKEWSALCGLALTVFATLVITALTDPSLVTSHLTGTSTRCTASPTSMPLTLISALALTRDLWQAEFKGMVLQTAKVLGLLFLPLACALIGQTRTREQVVRHSLWSLTAYLTIAYLQTMQWYYLWPIGLLCAVRWTPDVANVAAASCAVLFGYVMYFWTHNGWSPGSQVLGSLLCVALPVLLCVVGRRCGWSLCPLLETFEHEGRAARKARRTSERAAARR
jgi:hypothetical protein